ncbi:MAG: LptF/LptG family permease [Bacteroidetes bacterium]|nr:LptF/LptG family permease [Bacteroidota bacterium]
MKKLHLLLLRAFMPPFLASFSISLFILTLQFISTYQDDIFGKGFSGWVIAQLFLYAMVNLVKVCLPISLLLAGLMTLGKLGEQYELAAIKSAGISLFRVIYPLLLFAGLVTVLSLWLSWQIIPASNVRLYSLLYDVQQAKPEFALKPGVFNNSIPDYRIWYAERSPAGRLLRVYIWDHTDSQSGGGTVLVADSAAMRMDDRLLYLRLTLYKGTRYKEEGPGFHSGAPLVAQPFSRMQFDSLHYNVDMSGVGLQRTDENLFTRHQYTQDIVALGKSVDSLRLVPDLARQTVQRLAHQQWAIDSLVPRMTRFQGKVPTYKDSPLELFPPHDAQIALDRSLRGARLMKQWVGEQKNWQAEQQKTLNKYRYEYMCMFTVPLACLIMLFIGAPLGAIIRKGGLGVPAIISILFFILFYVLLNQGKKLAHEGELPPWLGAWLPLFIIAPIALYVTYQSTTDSRLFDLSAWKYLWARVLRYLRLRR